MSATEDSDQQRRAAKERFLREQAAAFDRDWAELDRIAKRLGASVVLPSESAAEQSENSEHKAADGTVRELVQRYLTDKDSPYHKLRYRTSVVYTNVIVRIESEHGHLKLADLKKNEIDALYQSWLKRGQSMAHLFVSMLRIMVNYGATTLENAECVRLSIILRHLKVRHKKSQRIELTAQQAVAIIEKAHEMGLHSLALAQALKIDTTLEQRDIIGDWVPEDEPGDSDQHQKNKKWLYGLRWEEIDDDLILHHRLSRNGEATKIALTQCRHVATELQKRFQFPFTRPRKGPLIVFERKLVPYSDDTFRHHWRKVADAAGIPPGLNYTDSRPSGNETESHHANGHAKAGSFEFPEGAHRA